MWLFTKSKAEFSMEVRIWSPFPMRKSLTVASRTRARAEHCAQQDGQASKGTVLCFSGWTKGAGCGAREGGGGREGGETHAWAAAAADVGARCVLALVHDPGGRLLVQAVAHIGGRPVGAGAVGRAAVPAVGAIGEPAAGALAGRAAELALVGGEEPAVGVARAR